MNQNTLIIPDPNRLLLQVQIHSGVFHSGGKVLLINCHPLKEYVVMILFPIRPAIYIYHKSEILILNVFCQFIPFRDIARLASCYDKGTAVRLHRHGHAVLAHKLSDNPCTEPVKGFPHRRDRHDADGHENHGGGADGQDPQGFPAGDARTESGPLTAADVLVRAGKPGLLLRNLDYLLSRCSSDNEVRALLEKTDTRNTVMLIQLLLHYEQEWDRGPRIFTFVKNSRLKKHEETAAEARRRRTVLAQRDRDAVSAVIRGMLERNLKGRLGRVYIDPAMKNAALPLQESAGQGGFGVLNRGTRIPLAPGKKIRAFTYWEKVHDIDLSVIGLGKDGEQVEFSWRSMAHSQSAAVTFSGDETSGFDGGAEFFDVDPVLFREKYPNIRRLIFCDNIFSDDDTPTFRDCVCRAGYMLRDTDDSGEIFEPRTVQSSF